MTRFPGLTPDQQLDEHEHVESTHRAAGCALTAAAALVVVLALGLVVAVLVAGPAAAAAGDTLAPGALYDDHGRPLYELDADRGELAATGVDPVTGAVVALALVGVGVQAVRLVRAERARRGGAR